MSGKGPRQFERNTFFHGKLMTARDFQTEGAYVRGKDWLQNRFLHDHGVVFGLRLHGPEGDAKGQGAGAPWRLTLEPGLAIDPCGREIVVPGPCDFDLKKLVEEAGYTDLAKLKKDALFVTLSYRECETEPVPVYARECATADQCQPNRVVEGYKIGVTDEPPEDKSPYKEMCQIIEEVLAPEEETGPLTNLGVVATDTAGSLDVVASRDSIQAMASRFKIYQVTDADKAAVKLMDLDNDYRVRLAAGHVTAWAGLETSVQVFDWPRGGIPQQLSRVTVDSGSIIGITAALKAETAIATVSRLLNPDTYDREYALIEISRGGTIKRLGLLPAPPAHPLALSPDGTVTLVAIQADNHWELLTLKTADASEIGPRISVTDMPIALDMGALDESQIFLVTTDKAVYLKRGTGSLEALALPSGFRPVDARLRGERAYIAGVGADEKPVLIEWDLAKGKSTASVDLTGRPNALSTAALPSQRIYVTTDKGVEVIDAKPIRRRKDLYQLLCQESMNREVGDCECMGGVYLAGIPVRDGKLVLDHIDNCTVRRIMLDTARLTGLLVCAINAVAGPRRDREIPELPKPPFDPRPNGRKPSEKPAREARTRPIVTRKPR